MSENRGDRADAIRILAELALDPQSPLDTEMLAKASLALIMRRKATSPERCLRAAPIALDALAFLSLVVPLKLRKL